MYGIYRTTRKLFGSWNKAIEAAGYKPNPVKFAEKHTANDAHICDSFAEKIIDDWLHERGIKHERNIKYPGNPKLTVDFVTEFHWIEFFGLAGEIQEYDKLLKKKRRICQKYNLKLIELYPKDITPENKLPDILTEKQIRVCST